MMVVLVCTPSISTTVRVAGWVTAGQLMMPKLQGLLNTIQVSLAEVLGKFLAMWNCCFARGCLLGLWAGGGYGDAVSEAAMVLF